jgi:hypothetical protein
LLQAAAALQVAVMLVVVAAQVVSEQRRVMGYQLVWAILLL